MGAALPPGSAGIVAIYDRGKAGAVDATLASAVRKRSRTSTAAVPTSSKPPSPRHKPAWVAKQSNRGRSPRGGRAMQ